MKYALIVLILLLNAIGSSAQQNNLFADAGVSFARFKPGASVTYNYKLARCFGLGIGAQDYDFHATMSTYQYIPAIFGELRFYIRPRRRSQLFTFFDLGVNYYKHNDDYWRGDNIYYNVRKDNGTYTGLGFGYFRRTAKRGWGPYASWKLISNGYSTNAFNIATNERSIVGWSDATFVVSVGYRF